MEIKEKSIRLKIAEKICEFTLANNLGQYNVAKMYDRKNRAYYNVSLAHADISGSISVYSHKYIILKFATTHKFLPVQSTNLFKCPNQLITFLREAFINVDKNSIDILTQFSTPQ